MQCAYCKTSIHEQALKCQFCQEPLGKLARRKNIARFIGAFFSLAIPIASLGLAYAEYQERIAVEEEKEAVMAAAQDILREVPLANISEAAKASLGTSANPALKEAARYLEANDYSRARDAFRDASRIDPSSIDAQKGLFYLDAISGK